MATIYRCDRCHAESTSRNEFARVEIPYANSYNEVSEEDNSIRDICISCVRLLHQWIAPLPKKEK